MSGIEPQANPKQTDDNRQKTDRGCTVHEGSVLALESTRCRNPSKRAPRSCGLPQTAAIRVSAVISAKAIPAPSRQLIPPALMRRLATQRVSTNIVRAPLRAYALPASSAYQHPFIAPCLHRGTETDH